MITSKPAFELEFGGALSQFHIPLCRFARVLAIVALIAVRIAALGQGANCGAAHPEYKPAEAQAALDRGVDAYRGADYDKAIAEFQTAVDLDPCLPRAKSFLGTALAQTVVPELDTPNNLAIAQRAIDAFNGVLADAPHDVVSMKQLAEVYKNIQKFDEAKTWQLRVLSENPNDAQAAYNVGVIDWSVAHRNAKSAFAAAGLEDDGEGNTKAPRAVMIQIRSQNSDLVAEGLQYLTKAVANQSNNYDAMFFLSLTYRRKADLDFDNSTALADDLANARRWSARGMATRKAKQDAKSTGPAAAHPHP
jgi:tetratricopeptide (TPR) repeat protein